MSSRRFIIQTGMGVDQHGQNMTTAAVRAVEDAIRRNCLCGLVEIVGLQDPQQMIVEVTLAVPYPDQVDVEKVKEALNTVGFYLQVPPPVTNLLDQYKADKAGRVN